MNIPFTDLLDLASEKVGGKALLANDEFFAPKENLLKATSPVFIPGKYTDVGKWMDGWESRRKRGPGHDWCVIRLGMPGQIHGINVDTAHFTGNYPEYCSIEACLAPLAMSFADLAKAAWHELLPKSKLQGGTGNYFAIGNGVSDRASEKRWTHLRLNIYPDGGVARLRVHGTVIPDWSTLKRPIDLAAAENGGTVVTCNDMFFGPKDNLILPGRAATMGDGWETQRKRGPGNDWIIVKLGRPGKVHAVDVDTHHFKGNFPESCSIEGCTVGPEPVLAADFRDRKDIVWHEVLPRTLLQADHCHSFEKELRSTNEKFDYLRLNIFPDGGVSRLRIYGDPS